MLLLFDQILRPPLHITRLDPHHLEVLLHLARQFL